jgi:hypothetical protein
MSESIKSESKAAETAPAPQDTKEPQVDFTTGDDERDPEEVRVDIPARLLTRDIPGSHSIPFPGNAASRARATGARAQGNAGSSR